MAALNYGRGEVVRAIRSVRPQFFRGIVNPFTLVANQHEYDLSAIEPPVWRPTRLLVPGQRPVRFRYRAEMDEEFEERETSTASYLTTVLYDINSGLIPLLSTTVTPLTTSTMTPADASIFSPGQIVSLDGCGPDQQIAGTASVIPTRYYGTVISATGGVLTVAPPMTHQPTNGQTIQTYARLVLKLANAPGQAMTGKLEYQFAMPKWKSFNDILDPIMTEHQDAVIYFAASVYLRAVNDQEATSWLNLAQGLKSQLMQDLEPLSGQNTEALGTDLGALD